MGCKAVNSWTLAGLMLAFVDLAIAYFLLCVSAFAFIPSKFLNFFELYLPCPCRGFFGYQNSNFCFQKVLVDWPVRKIYSVLDLIKGRFPFDLVCCEDHSSCVIAGGDGDGKCANGFIELEGQGYSSSFSSPRFQISDDREGGFDAKGKKIMNQKQKSAIRRRKRASLGYGKGSIVLQSSISRSIGIGAPNSTCNGSETRISLDPANDVEACQLDISGNATLDDGNAQNGVDLGGRFHHTFGFSGSDWNRKCINEESFSSKSTCNGEDKVSNVVTDADTIVMLERALEEEKAVRASLYNELEKERAAAATAADEALAMILRLQEDKASIEMEARQYQRMIDEKFVYDEEEMNILKEILVRRETEIHFLEKEVEAYREIELSENRQLEGDLSYTINAGEQRPSLPIDLDKTSPQMMQQVENSESVGEKEAPKGENWSCNYEQGDTAFGKEKTSNCEELHSVLSTSAKSSTLADNEKASRDTDMMSQGREVVQTFGEELEKHEECFNQGHSMRNDSMSDTESTVYDVHIVDDKTIIWKEDDGKESKQLSNSILGSDYPSTSSSGSQPDTREGSLDMIGRLPLPLNAQGKTLILDLPRSSSAVDSERLKIDAEVEWLREKLRIVQEEKEKRIFSTDHREMENARLKLMEEILKQLKEIQQQREPLRHASLPPLAPKVCLRKRRCRSASLEAFESS